MLFTGEASLSHCGYGSSFLRCMPPQIPEREGHLDLQTNDVDPGLCGPPDHLPVENGSSYVSTKMGRNLEADGVTLNEAGI